jgi:hypothetical protein
VDRNSTVTLPLTEIAPAEMTAETGDPSTSAPVTTTAARPRRPAVSKTAATTVPGRLQDGDDSDGLSYIAPDLRPLAVPVNSLTADPANARKHGERDLAALVDSLRLHGQQKAVVGCRTYRGHRDVVIAGSGTLAAARRLKWRFLAVSWFTGLEAEATAYAIRDNRTAELSAWDPTALAALAGGGVDLASLWHDPVDLARLLGDAVPVPTFTETDHQHRLDRLAALTCPACGAEVPR